MYEFLGSHHLRREPGSEYEYSNLGAGLLGHALGLRTGSSFDTLVRSEISDVLGLESTGVEVHADPARFAHGHTASLSPTCDWDMPSTAAAGGLSSTVDDLLVFLRAWLDRESTSLGSAMTMALATRRRAEKTGGDIALGWHLAAREGRELFWHNGSTGGYYSFAGFNPARRAAVVVLSNAANDITEVGVHLVNSVPPMRYDPSR